MKDYTNIDMSIKRKDDNIDSKNFIMHDKRTQLKSDFYCSHFKIFYREFASISPDTQMKGRAIDFSLLLKSVQEHQNDTYLAVMDTD